MDDVELKKLSNRGQEWKEFSNTVFDHIEVYTVPQYSDADWDNPENGDQMQSASLEDIQMNLRRYVNRMNTNARGKEEAIRDLIKIAHYACILWGKYNRGELDIQDTNTIFAEELTTLDGFYENLDKIRDALQPSLEKGLKVFVEARIKEGV